MDNEGLRVMPESTVPANSTISCGCSPVRTHRDSIIPEFWKEVDRGEHYVIYERTYKCGGCGKYPMLQYTLGMRI